VGFAEPWNEGSPILSSGESGVSGLSGDFGYVPFGHERVASRNHSTNVSSVSYDGANYIYSTPYGIYTWLQPGNILKFVNHYGEEVVSKSVYVLQYLSGQTWLPLIDFSGVASPIHNSTFYRLTYSVMDKKKVVGGVVIDFDCSDPSKPPKVSISFTKSALWNLGDFRWIWDVVPASNYRYYINDELTTNVNATYPDITAMSTPQSVGTKSKLYLGKDAMLNADGMWLSVGTEDYGATERQVGPEPFWNGKGTVSIFPINAAIIDPDIAYTEYINGFTAPGADGAWADYNVTLNKGIPKGSILEVALCQGDDNEENLMGVRTDGSALNRYILIHEAESGGEVVYTMPVKVHVTTGIIEVYHQDVSDLHAFRILGYFTNCDFTEAFGVNAVSTTGVWTDLDLGTANNLVHSVIISSAKQDASFTGGIRTNGGSLTRSLVIHEPEAGGGSGFMFYVKSDASDTIEYWISEGTSKQVDDLGYFGSTVDFVEGWAQVDVGASASWSPFMPWAQVAPQSGSETYIRSLCVLNGEIYGGTASSGNLLKWNGVNAWAQVAPQSGSETIIYSLCVLNGEIYGGTYPNGNLLKWNGVNAWTQVAPKYGSETYIRSLAVLNNEIYGGTIPSGNLLKWNGVNAWTQVAPIYGSETYILSLAVLNNEIYGGTYPNGNLLKTSAPFPKSAIVSLVLSNSDIGVEYNVGARTPGSALNRYILVHESESADGTEYNGYTVSVLSSASGVVELYTGLNTADYFMYAGYFKPAGAANTAPVNDACDSTATFDYNVLGWINMTVSDADLVANLYTVQITITTSDSKTSVYLWTQSTGVFSETSDPNGISSESGSVRVNIDTDTDKIAFKIKFTQVPALGNCNVQAVTTDDATASDTDTYTAEFRLIHGYMTTTVTSTIAISSTRLWKASRTSSVTGTIGLTLARVWIAQRTSEITGTVSLSTIREWIAKRANTINPAVAISSVRQALHEAASAITATVSLATSRLWEAYRSSAVTITVALSVAFNRVFNIASTISITVSVVTDKLWEQFRASTVNVAVSVSSSPIFTALRSSAVSITASVSTTIQRLVNAATSVTVNIGLASAATNIFSRLSAIAPQVSLSSAAKALHFIASQINPLVQVSSISNAIHYIVNTITATVNISSSNVYNAVRTSAVIITTSLSTTYNRFLHLETEITITISLVSSRIMDIFRSSLITVTVSLSSSLGKVTNIASTITIMVSVATGRLWNQIRSSAISIVVGITSGSYLMALRDSTISISVTASTLIQRLVNAATSITVNVGLSSSRLLIAIRDSTATITVEIQNTIQRAINAATQVTVTVGLTTARMWLAIRDSAITASITISSILGRVINVASTFTVSVSVATSQLLSATRESIITVTTSLSTLTQRLLSASTSVTVTISLASARLWEAIRSSAVSITVSVNTLISSLIQRFTDISIIVGLTTNSLSQFFRSITVNPAVAVSTLIGRLISAATSVTINISVATSNLYQAIRNTAATISVAISTAIATGIHTFSVATSVTVNIMITTIRGFYTENPITMMIVTEDSAGLLLMGIVAGFLLIALLVFLISDK
jgi:hypothetical protein